MDPTVALDGRALGRRGAQTRRRLLDATAELLETHGIRDLRVVDIARAVGSSPATFYQYFRDVEEAVLALAEEVGDEIEPLVACLEPPWDADAGLDDARALVERFRRLSGIGTARCCAPATSPRRRATSASGRSGTARCARS